MTARGHSKSGRRRRGVRRTVPRLPPLRDRVGPGLRVLFVGINPGIRSALTGHHFAGYSNRFWKLLGASGLADGPLTCEDDDRLPGWGYGITNLVARPSRSIDDLDPAEYAAGRRALVAKVARLRPEVVALVGVTLYRALFPDVRAKSPLGLQAHTMAGVPVFVLPNPSGRNAHYSFDRMLKAFRELRRHLEP